MVIKTTVGNMFRSVPIIYHRHAVESIPFCLFFVKVFERKLHNIDRACARVRDLYYQKKEKVFFYKGLDKKWQLYYYAHVINNKQKKQGEKKYKKN